MKTYIINMSYDPFMDAKGINPDCAYVGSVCETSMEDVVTKLHQHMVDHYGEPQDTLKMWTYESYYNSDGELVTKVNDHNKKQQVYFYITEQRLIS